MTNEIVLYQPNEQMSLEVKLENETVWLTQQQIADLFGVKRPAVTKHLGNIFREGELDITSVSSILEHTAADGKIYSTQFYNLDAILSVGYRVNSKNATLFRRWANQVLKEYMLRGYAIIHKHNAQYPPIDIVTFDRSHDRFLCIDDTVYHLGASIKDLGKKWFAFNRMEMPTTELLQKITI